MTNRKLTDAEALAIGKRWVACGGWRWMPGMVSMPDEHGRTLRFVRRRQVSCSILFMEQEDGPKIEEEPLPWELRPDLRDPATKGCCLALTRDRKGWVSVEPLRPAIGDCGWDTPWRVLGPIKYKGGSPYDHEEVQEVYGEGDTEAEALTAAWEAVHGGGASKETRR